MTQYIDKAAVIAEIEKELNTTKKYSTEYVNGKKYALKKILSFLDTLEAKEIGVDLGDPKGDKSSEYTVDTKTFEVKDDVVSNDTISNPLEISRHGNSHIGETLEEAAENYPSIIRTISPQWETEVESAFIAGAKWQKEQTIEKICKWLEDNVDHYAYNKDFVPNAKERFIKMFRRAEI